MAATSQPISIARDQRSNTLNSSSHLNPPSFQHTSFASGSPMHISSSSSHLAQQALNHHFANPRFAGTSPRSAESSTSWSIHPGPLFVSAGSLGSTSGSLGANSVSGSTGSYRGRMYPGLGCSPAQVLNPLDPEFKFRGFVGSMESDHSSLINPHMSEREVEQFRNFTCCGLPLNDLHALVEHFETYHVCLVDPLQNHPLMQQFQQQHPNAPGGALPYQPMSSRSVPTSPSTSSAVPNTASGSGPGSASGLTAQASTSNESSLAGALGPSSSSATAAPVFDIDDMDLDMDPEPEQAASTSSPAPSTSSSSNPNTSSSRSSPMGGDAGPLPLTQPQRFANANGNININGGTMSSVSSPPDTPLLMTPVSPFANTAPASQTSFFNASGQAQGQEGGLIGLASNIQTQGQGQQQQTQTQVPSGPAAFDTVHLPAKQHSIYGHGGGGMFAHPYAGAARRHTTHPLSPLSSGSTSTSGSTANSPASATGPAFGFGNVQAGLGGAHGPALHHTQSLYALKLARHVATEREREELVKKAMNGYAGYEDYSRGFPGTTTGGGDAVQVSSSSDIGVGVGVFGGDAGLGGMRMSVGPTESAIHPGLLFGNANGNANTNMGGMNGAKTEPATARTTPAPSRSGSPSSSGGGATSSTALSTPGPSTPASSIGPGPSRNSKSQPQASTTLSRPSSSLLLSKPFKCPTPGCTKSYKQANGLKYHVTHGQCSFTPPPEYSSISELGLSMGVNLKLGPMGLEGLETLSEKERRDAEREAERRLRPFCCQVKPCTRRYKNMNGLRYHYQHSGDHGAIGLRMLAEGRHDATRSQSAERSDEEEYREGQRSAERGLGVSGGAVGSSSGYDGERVEEGSLERGRKRERREETDSAPTTPGATLRSPFTTQAQTFGFGQQHQRTNSGSSGGGGQQPRSPLSQQFPPPIATPAQQNQAQNNNNNLFNINITGMNSLNGFNTRIGGGMNGVNVTSANASQYAFAVQSQPASAYASPWGSRSGSPTGMGPGMS